MTAFEKTYAMMKNPIFMVGYVILVFLSYWFKDQAVATYFHQMDSRESLHVLNILTALGKWKFYIVTLVALIGFFRYIKVNREYEMKSWYVLACVVLTNLVGLVLKISLGRARPELLFSDHIYGFYWFQLKDAYWSCPSGHTLTIIGMASALSVLFPKYFYAFMGVAVLVVLTRVVLFHHYLSDVMIGFYIAILAVGLLTQYLKKYALFNRVS